MVSEGKIFENGRQTTTDDGACVYFNLTSKPDGSGETAQVRKKKDKYALLLEW